MQHVLFPLIQIHVITYASLSKCMQNVRMCAHKQLLTLTVAQIKYDTCNLKSQSAKKDATLQNT